MLTIPTKPLQENTSMMIYMRRFLTPRTIIRPTAKCMLAASIAPRYVYIASAKEDIWADPVSEMLTCVAISKIYEKYGKRGFLI